MTDFIKFYKLSNGNYRYCHYLTKTFEARKNHPIFDVVKTNTFFLFKGYEASDKGLKQFSDDLVIFRDQILNSKISKIASIFDYFDNSFQYVDGGK